MAKKHASIKQKSQRDLEVEIADAVKYITEQRARNDNGGKKIRKKRLAQVRIVIQRVEAARHTLVRILEDIANQEDLSGAVGEEAITAAYLHVVSALAPLSDARVVLQDPPATRRQREQRTAARLACVICEHTPRQARRIAEKIMTSARIPQPEKSTLTRHIKEARKWLART